MANLGPKPRMNAGMGGAGGGVTAPGMGGGNLAFYDSGTQPMQGQFPSNSPPQPVTSPFPQQHQHQQQPPSMGGGVQAPFGSMVQPSTYGQVQQPGHFPPPKENLNFDDDDFENEPPILEELGINVEHILLRMKGVAFFKQVEQEVLEDLDLSGPLAIIMALSTCLLCAGKITFSYVYGFGVSGCVLIWMLINLMSQKGGIDMYRTASVLGYGLIPVVIMAFLGVFVSLNSSFGSIVAGLCIMWATATASRFFATAIAMNQQRWLVAYPVGLFYVCFSLLTVF